MCHSIMTLSAGTVMAVVTHTTNKHKVGMTAHRREYSRDDYLQNYIRCQVVSDFVKDM